METQGEAAPMLFWQVRRTRKKIKACAERAVLQMSQSTSASAKVKEDATSAASHLIMVDWRDQLLQVRDQPERKLASPGGSSRGAEWLATCSGPF